MTDATMIERIAAAMPGDETAGDFDKQISRMFARDIIAAIRAAGLVVVDPEGIDSAAIEACYDAGTYNETVQFYLRAVRDQGNSK